MSKYMILGQEITFSNGEDLYCIFETAARIFKDAIIPIFGEWYIECRDIETVLDRYLEKAAELVFEHSSGELFSQLPEFGVYDMGKREFQERCVDFSYIEEAYTTILDIYNDIVSQQEAEREYREERKASRGRFVGGGFELGGALKGMATAGLMNAAAGALHSIGNSIGNANTDMEAEALKESLYLDEYTMETLLVGIRDNIHIHFHLYMDFLNERFNGRIHSDFDEEKSEALFRNAVNIPEKREFLLVEAFKKFPWNRDVYEYIAEHFPSERENMTAIGQEYGIELKAEIKDEPGATELNKNEEKVLLE